MLKNFRKIFCLFFASLLVLSSSFFAINYNTTTCANAYGIKEFIDRIFGSEQQANQIQEMPEVYVGGSPLGFCLYCDGVVVIAVGNVHTEKGVNNTIIEGEIYAGDIVKKINGISIKSVQTIEEQMQFQEQENKVVELQIERNKTISYVQVLPAKDIMTNKFKLGLWVRDNSAGVGTLTYVRADNNRFGALGHSVCDIDTGTSLPIDSGEIYKCNIIGVSSSKKGTAGELKGLFLKNGTVLGNIDKNNDLGVYGTADQELSKQCGKKMKVAARSQVQTGKASILCCISGSTVCEYSVEIIKTSKQSKTASKSLVIRITDQELIEKTGGIVQGMSGSPIVQNGMLVGAVTHVFLNDPTKGYGVYAEYMIDN